jgi:hypothetical protein
MKKEEIEKQEADLKKKGIRHNLITAFLDDEDSSKTATFFLRKPDKASRDLIARTTTQKGGLDAVYVAIKNLQIKDYGDDPAVLLQNDYALASCEDAVVRMLEVQKAQLKKN